ncbi:SRPBCC family protein [Streptomyces sp. NPDC058691]|uniref:SRPBCC family protein n=1 Tax=Streptomyces sp. NPDC058691 TaxID=3346601 RepID=UPI00364B68D1
MTTFTQKQDYEAAASAVWDLIGDFYAVDRWMPGVAATVRDDGRRTRTVTLDDGATLVERLLEEGQRFHHYRFDDPGPVPVRDFKARITVVETGPGRSAIEWTASFDPAPGVPEDAAQAAMSGFYQACLDRVFVLLGA